MSTPTSPKSAPKAKALPKVLPKVLPKAKKTAPRPMGEPIGEPVAPAIPVPEPSQAEIAQRAYEIWLERGGASVANWLEAERQLRTR